MTYTFIAKNIELDDDGYSLTLALADENMGEGDYVIFQKSLESDEQDKKFGFDKVHIEVGSQNTSGYGGISRIMLSNAALRIELNEKGRQFLRMQDDILVTLPGEDPHWEEKLRRFAAAIDQEFPFEIR